MCSTDRSQCSAGRLAGASLVALLLLGAAVHGLPFGARSFPHRPSLSAAPAHSMTELTIIVEGGQRAKLWGQCGGEGYSGPTQCEEGSICHHKPLEKLES